MVKSIRLSSNFVLFVLCLIGCFIAILPTPACVDPRAYPIFGVFVALIIGILLQPYPITVLTLIGLFVCIIFGLISPRDAFACFGETVIWLIAIASIAAKAFSKTHLGRRLACFFIKKTGKSSFRLAYGLTLSELIFSPMVPSNTARATCITLPLAVSVAESLGSDPKNRTEKKVGTFLILCMMHANQLTSALFLTAMASNPMLQKFMGDLNVDVSWMEWFIMAFVPGIVCLLIMPCVLYKLSPPELTKIENSEEIAQKQLDELPPMQRKEVITVFVFLGMLVCWIFGTHLNLNTATVALGGVCVLFITRVLTIDDFVGAKDIWDVIVWLAILNIIASKLTEYGLVQHYSTLLNNRLAGFSWGVVLLLVSIIYYLARYIIPGNVLHACAVFPAFAKLLIVCGVPPKLGCMTLAIITAYCGFVTPYATSPCPIILNTGYIDQKLWWRIGFITTIIYFVVWGSVGGVWWKLLGYW